MSDLDSGGGLEALLDRKAEGIAVLVSGAVPAAIHRSMSARLLGCPEVDRRRVLALTSREEQAVTDRLPPGASTASDRLRVVLGGGWTRSGATADGAAGASTTAAGVTASGADATDGPVGTLPEAGVTAMSDPSLATYGERVARQVTELCGDADGCRPGQLRLCVDSLDHLVDGYDDGKVLRFAHLLADQVRSHDGMTHFHTRHSYENLPVSGLSTVTEVVVRLRLDGGTPEFRLSLDGEPVSDWTRIPPLPD
ncbi:hypothetical protein BRD13_08245 [Halobacteriales archaeon SW_5_70_135]|nr:MAG: hypothetical protein BRD13_08245 [Halobacteriales archaeon SW_5_70_135]